MSRPRTRPVYSRMLTEARKHKLNPRLEYQVNLGNITGYQLRVGSWASEAAWDGPDDPLEDLARSALAYLKSCPA